MARKKIIAIARKKSWVKDVKRGPGIKLKRVYRRKKTWKIPDKGAPGKFRGEKWFKPKGTLGGWEKTQSSSERRRRASRARTDLSSGRALQSLSNVTTDRETKRIARADAKYFFERHKGRK